MNNATSKSHAKVTATKKHKKSTAKLPGHKVDKKRMPVKNKNLKSKTKHNIDSSIFLQFGKAVLKEDILFQAKVDERHIPIQKPVLSNISDLRKTKKHSIESLKQKTPRPKRNEGEGSGMTKAKEPNMMFDLWSNSKVQNDTVKKRLMKTVESKTDEKKKPEKKEMNPIWSAVNFCIDGGAELRSQLDAKRNQKE